MITLILEADVKPTENIEKIKKAMLNISPSAQFEKLPSDASSEKLRAKAIGVEAISVLAKKFRDQRIIEAVRQVLLKSIHDNHVVFGMHRQAAFVNRFHICDMDDYSAMGPICVRISAENIHDIIDYISPPTTAGKPQYRTDLKLE
jgi:predicted RNA binding protein with dsRBD fold (UPF0201 family)